MVCTMSFIYTFISISFSVCQQLKRRRGYKNGFPGNDDLFINSFINLWILLLKSEQKSKRFYSIKIIIVHFYFLYKYMYRELFKNYFFILIYRASDVTG